MYIKTRHEEKVKCGKQKKINSENLTTGQCTLNSER